MSISPGKYLEFTFVLGSQCISLEQTQTHNKELRIEYNPSNDSLYVRDNRKNPELTPEQMFQLKIPKEEIYKGYTSIIDKYMANEKIFGLLTDSNNEGIQRLNYEKNKSMVLKKIR